MTVLLPARNVAVPVVAVYEADAALGVIWPPPPKVAVPPTEKLSWLTDGRLPVRVTYRPGLSRDPLRPTASIPPRSRPSHH